MLDSESEAVYASVQDSDRSDFKRHSTRQRSFVTIAERQSLKPPLPSREDASRSRTRKNSNSGSPAAALYTKSKKRVIPSQHVTEDITSISDDIVTDSKSVAHPLSNDIQSSGNVRLSRQVHRRSSSKSDICANTGRSFDEHLSERRVVAPRRHSLAKRHQNSEITDSGIIIDRRSDSDMANTDSETQNWNLIEQLQHLVSKYQDKIIQKDEMLEICENEISHLAGRLENAEQEVSKMQNVLQERQTSSPVTSIEWQSLQEQAGQLLEENQNLTQQVEHLQHKLRENNMAHQNQVMIMRGRLDATADDKTVLEQELVHLRDRFERLREEYNVNKLQKSDFISKEEHSESVRECKRLLENLKAKYGDEIITLANKLKSTQKENASCFVEVSNFKCENEQLIAENKVLLTTHSKMLKKLQHTSKVAARSKMDSQCLKLKTEFLRNQVERLSEERNKCAHMASCFYDQANELLLRLDDAHMNRDRFLNLKTAKIKLMQKWEEETARLLKEERAFSRQKREFESTMRQLKRANKSTKAGTSKHTSRSHKEQK